MGCVLNSYNQNRAVNNDVSLVCVINSSTKDLDEGVLSSG